MNKIYYEDEEITICSTDRDYDFICTVENKADRAIVIVFNEDYEYLQPFTVCAEDWVGILADEEGWEIVKAFDKGCFYTIFEEDFTEDIIFETNKEPTTDECMEIFKKYDTELYNYYQNNMYYFGCDARRYAEYLKRTKEGA